ncbi:hypothetical protein D9757_007472 [Collybiopsis confluens]|uniref:alpha-1,2-Mannosidase n=1 Tax=Collybiopsis confluens TaxID=2823264 RepID=A0A8H5M8F9_9AGAR|nr:hypothetical protein D9757_007472 [Collybiopsis confluens]
MRHLWRGRGSAIRSDHEEPIDSTLERSGLLPADVAKRDAVVTAFKHAWGAYERDAFGFDEYHPISKRGENLSRQGGIGYTVTDAIDTMYLMGLGPEFQRARTWIEKELVFERSGVFSTFETTIRVLGGLLSTYHLTSDDLFLRRAKDLASRLLSAFDTPSGLPLPSVNLQSKEGVPERGITDRISTAEAATLQLEFRYLAEVTGNETYWFKAEKVMEVVARELERVGYEHGLVPIFMSASSGTFKTSEIRLGSRGDSYYEYLLKQYLQTARTEPVYREVCFLCSSSLYQNNNEPHLSIYVLFSSLPRFYLPYPPILCFSPSVPFYFYLCIFSLFASFLRGLSSLPYFPAPASLSLYFFSTYNVFSVPCTSAKSFTIPPLYVYLIHFLPPIFGFLLPLIQMYQEAMNGIHTHLVHHTPQKHMSYIAELHPKDFYSGSIGDVPESYKVHHKQDHLVCFLAGSLMLGAVTSGARGGGEHVGIGVVHGDESSAMRGKWRADTGNERRSGEWNGRVSIPPLPHELTKEGSRDWETGVGLLETCMATHGTATGLAPEIAMFWSTKEEAEEAETELGKAAGNREWYIKGSRPGGPASYDARYMLRPETVESLYIAYRLTGDSHYRDYAWGIFSSIEKYAKLPGGGYATVLDVDTVPVTLDDKQETFFLSETLKYLYLIFCDSSVLPLHGGLYSSSGPIPFDDAEFDFLVLALDVVFNTEAHPLPVFMPTIKPLFRERSR